MRRRPTSRSRTSSPRWTTSRTRYSTSSSTRFTSDLSERKKSDKHNHDNIEAGYLFFYRIWFEGLFEVLRAPPRPLPLEEYLVLGSVREGKIFRGEHLHYDSILCDTIEYAATVQDNS